MSSFRSRSARKSCRNQSKSIKFVMPCDGHVDGMKNSAIKKHFICTLSDLECNIHKTSKGIEC